MIRASDIRKETGSRCYDFMLWYSPVFDDIYLVTLSYFDLNQIYVFDKNPKTREFYFHEYPDSLRDSIDDSFEFIGFL